MMKIHAPKKRVILRVLPLGAVLGLCLLPALLGSANVNSQPTVRAENKYIGSAKCSNCHNAEASGNQWEHWSSAGHANAFKVLLSDEAKKIATEKGIPDASKSDQCLKCHVTGFGLDEKLFKKSFDAEEGIGCEACHGPGNDHARARFRAANDAEDGDEGFGDAEAEASYTELPDGEIGMAITRELCVKCHNKESPTYKPFCFYKRMESIRHLNPLKPRTDEERAAMLVCGCGDTCPCDHDCVEGCGVPPKK